jgi:hypothetical protein
MQWTVFSFQIDVLATGHFENTSDRNFRFRCKWYTFVYLQ